MELQINKTINWLREQVKKAGARGLIVGVSGGIDSALVCFLIKKAFPANSLGVILPCDSYPQDREDALSVIKACNINYAEIDLTEEHNSIMSKVKKELDNKELNKESLKISDANLRARLRMSTLYSIANIYNYLVVGTDNAAELFIGYFTKYGDGGVDILPIANLTKRQVYQWSTALGIPESVMNKAPSAGLWEGQTDEEEIGISYDKIDDFLEGKKISQQDIKLILELHSKTEHKRNTPTTCPKF
ncbi:MAG TPA: NAD(+) synthase [Eubacteriaceae bacterium]|nr:NAD(+) synthase [Eubacteriaceae bacterium]